MIKRFNMLHKPGSDLRCAHITMLSAESHDISKWMWYVVLEARGCEH